MRNAHMDATNAAPIIFFLFVSFESGQGGRGLPQTSEQDVDQDLDTVESRLLQRRPSVRKGEVLSFFFDLRF